MHLLHQQQQYQLFYLSLFLVTQTTCIPIKETIQSIRCNFLQQNCTSLPHIASLNSVLPSTLAKLLTVSTTPQTTHQRLTTTSSASNFDSFSNNLKRAAFILAGIALGLGILRICLMMCKSRSRHNSLSNRHSSVVRPQIATIEHHQFKPDLPPAYAEAMANAENDRSKLPSYEELPYEQRQEQHVHNNEGYISTPM